MSFKKYLENRDFSKIHRAGLIPVYMKDDVVEVCLRTSSDPKYGGSDFQIAKGEIDEGETPMEAAIREAKEELGFTVNGAPKLLWNDKKNRMHYFYIITDTKKLGQHDYETGKVEWWSLDKAEKDMRDWQRKLIPMIKRRLGIK